MLRLSILPGVSQDPPRESAVSLTGAPGLNRRVLALQECQRKLDHKLSLDSYLLKPVQRITKYQLLLKVRRPCPPASPHPATVVLSGCQCSGSHAVCPEGPHGHWGWSGSSCVPRLCERILVPQEMLKYSKSCEGAEDLQEALSSILGILKAVNDSMHLIAITGYDVRPSPSHQLAGDGLPAVGAELCLGPSYAHVLPAIWGQPSFHLCLGGLGGSKLWGVLRPPRGMVALRADPCGSGSEDKGV